MSDIKFRPELMKTDVESANDVRWVIGIVKKQNIDEFRTLEKKLFLSKTKNIASQILPHIVSVYGSTKMIECMQYYTGIEWDEEYDIMEYISEDALKGLAERKVSALYLATFMDRTDIACTLIKCSGENNIRFCFRTLQLSNPMEEVFMIVLAKQLKMKHSALKPAVIPGHREKDGKRTRVYIVYSVHITPDYIDELDDIGLVMFRNPYIYTLEGERNTKKLISPEDAKRAKKATSKHQDMLWKNHSNLNIISVSPLIYRENGAKIIDKPCIELYCSTKGVVPLGELEFPKQLYVDEGDYIDVDVHEGYFMLGGYDSIPSIVRHPTLKMGCDIGRSTVDASGQPPSFTSGTHGPFVKFNNKIGFLTCAHVVFNDPSTSPYNDYQYDGNDKIEVTQPSVDVKMFKDPACGHVHRAIFNPQLDPSVDVAVIEITDQTRIPTTGQFSNTRQSSYERTGFEELPEYNSGLIQIDVKHFSTTHTVFKFGSSTDVTRGLLEVNKVNARPLSTVLDLPSHSRSFLMTNQYQVFGCHPTLTFCTAGDSGSAVFMKRPCGDLVCIGMVIGYMNVNTNPHPCAVVTPIGAILNALGPEYSIASFP
ncbi:uncharacterized protein LOC117317349 [Pecten maximus]|uniref:uncharacterized protein LOC117317349 n=1 Tax=Pecten maximus TaxID=6579 RepID=UPI001458881E|nr:uncharacterized protein LOC117317349 [Pecten maximus]